MQKLLYAIGALLLLLIIIGFALPRSHRVAAMQEIDAHPATVFALVNDFRRFALWSPLSEADPDVRIVHSGAARGEGATMSWNGAIAGSGTQTIIESRPHEHVGIVINPGEAGEAKSWFDLAPGTGTTIVTWSFETDYGINIVARYFASMLGGIVGRDYQRGLENLKDLAESLPAADFSDVEIERLAVEATEIAYIRTNSRPGAAAMSDAMGAAYFEILAFIDAQGLDEAGAPLAIKRTFSGSELVFDAAIPVRGVSPSTPRDGAVKLGYTYEGSVLRVKHVGSYRELTGTHRKIVAYLAAHGIERNGASWESYVSDPADVPEDALLTYVYYPIRPI